MARDYLLDSQIQEQILETLREGPPEGMTHQQIAEHARGHDIPTYDALFALENAGEVEIVGGPNTPVFRIVERRR